MADIKKSSDALAAVLVGSKNDWPKIKDVFEQLEKSGIPYDKCVLSAHRDPEELREYLSELPSREVKIIITAAGMSNALSGTVAAFSELPVIGIPIEGDNELQTEAALLSTLMMPPGKPVATVAPNGGKNAALLAERFLKLIPAD